MRGLRLYTSNRLEALLDALVGVVGRPLADPLAVERVVVPNRGLSRWLSWQLAERLGVCSNVRFAFPDQFLQEAARVLLPGAPAGRPFDTDVLAWRVLVRLPEAARGQAGRALEHYLEGGGYPEARDLKALQLARTMAETLELYTVFRADLLRGWEAGDEPGDWQAELWRSLAAEHPGAHRAARMAALLEALPRAAAAGPPAGLPERISIFGLGTLAPVRLQVFSALAELVPVHLFALNPSKAYWSDLRSHREMARRARMRAPTGGAPLPAEGEHYEVGNPLLASLGRLGREFFDELAEVPAVEAPDLFRDPGEGSLLACLQSDVLHLRQRGTPDRVEVAAGDRSVEVHVCHSPQREVEVLHDQMLAWFQDLPGLEPGEILVVTPDPETYAPFVWAVFGGCPDPACRIPFALADGSLRRESPLAGAFLALLGLPGSRFGAAGVLDLLEVGALRRRFGFEDGDRAVVRRWVEETGVRWGVDAAHRAAQGLPAFEENSWRAGLARLLLGYALGSGLGASRGPEGGERLFAGVLPYDDVEGSDGRILGCLAELAERLFAWAGDFERPRPLSRWAEDLLAAFEGFFLPDEEEESEAQRVRGELGRLAELAREAAFGAEVSLRAVRVHLEAELGREASGGGYRPGRVTFAGLRALRSVPFRVIALIGMNDGVFPRVGRAPGFDRMARDPRPGDPTGRDEDRYAFLETLLAAREKLYVSFVGRRVRDNQPIPPSVVVSELFDALAEGFAHPGGELPGAVTTHQRLQPFSPDYFRPGSALSSASVENLQGVRALFGPATEPRPFVRSPLPQPDGLEPAVDLGELVRFFSHPVKAFLQRRLGLRLGEDAYGVEEREPVAVAGLDRYRVEEELTARALAGGDLDGAYPVLRAQGRLPPGRPGEVAFEVLRGRVRGFLEAARPHLAGAELPPLDLDVGVGAARLAGRLAGARSGVLLRYRCARLKGRDLVRAWVEHLALAVVAAPGYPEETVVLGTDEGWRFRRPSDPEALLAALLEAYARGLCAPLPFFPETSLEYARRSLDPKYAGRELAEARKVWEGGYRRPGEGSDAYLCQAFGGIDPLDPRGPLGDGFESLALALGRPLLEHREAP
ncbi:MAG: exodeoxyribonuclease V subunit gamma [Deferrisomatales bacterium]|nr:exodeoxyribonuclease V subunit gamma [Deferrisomatales bacterium]